MKWVFYGSATALFLALLVIGRGPFLALIGLVAYSVYAKGKVDAKKQRIKRRIP